MRLGVISDTHGHLRYALDAVRMLQSLKVDALIHCGDVGGPAIIALFADWPAHFVLGNVDHDAQQIELAVRAAGHSFHGSLGRIELAGKRIAFTHGDNASLLRAAITDGRADLVCYGHTHRAEWHDEGATRVLNPGALYRANPHTLAIVELDTLAVTILPV
jgi:hypothetical protein